MSDINLLSSLSDLERLTSGIHHLKFELAGQLTPCVILKSKEGGPKVMITSMLHHDELIGPGLIHWLVNNKTLIESIEGTLILFPFLSLLQIKMWRGLGVKNNYLTEDETIRLAKGKSVWNPNRFFPGNKDGEWLERFSFDITRKLLPGLNGLIDLHCCRMIDGSFAACDKNNEMSIKLALALDLDFVDLQVLEDLMIDTMYLHASQMGVPSVLVEIPGYKEIFYDWAFERCKGAITKGLLHLGLIKGEGKFKNEKAVFWRSEPCSSIKVGEPGYFQPLVKVGQILNKGSALGELLCLETFKVKEVYHAPFDGACASIGPAKGYSILNEEDTIIDFKPSHHLR